MTALQRQERISDIQERLDSLNDLQEGNEEEGIEARGWTTDETTEVRSLLDELDELQAEEDNYQRLATRTQSRARIDRSHSHKSPEKRLEEAHSVTRAVQDFKSGKLEGAEKEMHDEATRMARAANLPFTGNGVLVVLPREQKRADASTPLAAANLIPTNQMTTMQGYAPQLILDQLGVTTHYGLTGVNNFPVSDNQAQSAFVGETAASTTVNPNVRRPVAQAKGLRTKSPITWLLKASAGPEADRVALANMLRAEQNKINQVALVGGGANEPVGILGDAAVNTVVSGANGFTYDVAIDMQTKIHSEDATDMGTMGYVVTPGVRGQAQKKPVEAGDALRVWNALTPNLLLGYQALFTSLMPSNGGAGSNLHSAIFGAWSQLHVCNWDIRELIIDNVSDDHQAWLKSISFLDIVLANPKAFTKVVDIDVTV